MARPQSPQYDARRDGIVAAAARLYASRGFRGASVADLAAACGTSKSLIYHYFGAKEDILYEVMAAHLDALVLSSDEALQAPDPEQRLRALTLGFMRLYAGAQDSHKVLLNELDNLPLERRADVVDKQRRIIAVVEQLLRTLQPGAARVALPLTMLFFGMINWTHTWFKPEGALSSDALADLAVDLMLRGLGGIQAS